jgi:hypothetical protein
VSNSTSRPAKETSRLRWLPGLATLRSYESAWLTHDLVAGVVLTTMLAPVGIAYAVASGVGAIYGLYATIACLLAYALFGPSRILVLGPDSSLAAVIFGVVAPLSGGDPHRAIAIAGVMALVSGGILIVAGIARLGFVTELLSKPIRYGYMNGIALTVLISQLPKLLGFKISSAGPLRDLWSIAGAIASGKVNWVCRDSRHLLLRLGGERAYFSARFASPRPARVFNSLDSIRRLCPRCHWRPCCLLGVVRRHQRPLPHLRCAHRHARRSQSGNGGARRGQSCRRIVPGLPGEQQLIAHSGR